MGTALEPRPAERPVEHPPGPADGWPQPVRMAAGSAVVDLTQEPLPAGRLDVVGAATAAAGLVGAPRGSR